MFNIIAQDSTGIGIPSGPAWAVGIAIVIWALTGIIAKILELRWNAGSKARIEEMAAQVTLNKSESEQKLAEAKLAQADVDEVVAAYEEKLKEVRRDCETQIAKMREHVDIIDKKLDASEGRERECASKLAELTGRLQILERLYKLENKIDAQAPEVIKAAVEPIVRKGVHDLRDDIHSVAMRVDVGNAMESARAKQDDAKKS